MTCTPCTCLQESAEGYFVTSSSDTPQLSLLSGSHTPAKSCENEPQKDGSPACTCGKATSDCFIHPNTRDKWIASMQDSLARILVSLESRQAYLKEPDQVFTAKSCASLAWLDQSSCSWKTYQRSLLTDSEPYSQTWPRWGMTQDGYAYAHPMSERRITETGGFCWPTPNAEPLTSNLDLQCSGDGRTKPNKLGWAVAQYWPTPRSADHKGTTNPESAMKARQRGFGANLPEFVAELSARKMYPTATATAYKGWSPGHNRAATDDRLDYTIERESFRTGQSTPPMRLNPNWVAWLMGFPIGWANLKDTETPKSRCKPQQPTDSLEDSE